MRACNALGQVIAFCAEWRHTVQELQRALNAVLPPEIVIRECSITRPDFHPRYDALWRQYRYTVLNEVVRSPLWRRYAYHVPGTLDVEAMRMASRHLLGSHDFAAFGQPTHGSSTVRNVMDASWWADGTRLVFEITGSAFLRRMVRTLVGTLLQVGLGLRPPGDLADLLLSGDRAAAGPPAPACGLCLMKIGYAD